ncbi:hypothetical protein BDV28DRAFT_157525 [Aspergillus coremiiformis]|uniref:LysM domain-containing protein n=1 Tax=Aspergillus coremiiformis TaxID=138285 RepID=A0A5N6Z597_9EURO|nr:hypothetical protein BDV28DRAFT_157525 [Aspergillus coremiiformis]
MAPFHLTLILLQVLLGTTTSTNTASTTWENFPSHPTFPGTARNCNKWYTAKKGDDCSTVERAFDISAEDFFRWNPDVSKDCLKNFWVDNSYCVGVGPNTITNAPTSTSTTTTTSIPTSTSISTSAASNSSTTNVTYTFNHPITTWNITEPPRETAWPPTKTQAGQSTSCIKWHEVRIGDTCDTITNRYSSWMTREELLEWNPGLKEDCKFPFVGYFVCVMIKPTGVRLSYPSEPVIIPEPSPYTGPPPICPDPNYTPTVFSPSPTQPGMATKCQAGTPAPRSCRNIASTKTSSMSGIPPWDQIARTSCPTTTTVFLPTASPLSQLQSAQPRLPLNPESPATAKGGTGEIPQRCAPTSRSSSAHSPRRNSKHGIPQSGNPVTESS